MPIDYERINSFIAQRPVRKEIASVLRRAEFEIVWVESFSQEVWGFRLKLNRPLRQLLGTSREVLVWVVEYDEFQARTVMQADQLIKDNQPRLSEEFAVVITNDPETAKYVDETAQNMQVHYVGFSLDEFRHFEPSGPNKLIPELQRRFFTKDLYFLSTAITSSRTFFGRKNLIAELMASLRTGSSHIGLFGLRKMGKTSLLFRIIENLRVSGEVYAHIDVQRIDAIQPCAEYLLWSIGEQLLDTNQRLRRIDGFLMFGKYRTFGEVPNTNRLFELFDHDLRLAIQETKRKVILLFDEIELMSPEAPGQLWGDSYVRVWRLLRGLSQQFGGSLGFFVTGTNPSVIEVNRLGDRENPTYNYFIRYFLSPFSRAECEELLTAIGAPMGLEWPPESVDQMMRYVGGHPFLLRALASKVHRSLLPRTQALPVTWPMIASTIDSFLLETNSTLSQMIEVLDDYYPDEFMLLETLSLGKIGEFRELAYAFPNDVDHLVGYGLVDRDLTRAGLKVELLQTWLQRRSRSRELARQTDSVGMYAANSEIEGYLVEGLISRTGGFGEVYRARRVSSDRPATVALKVLRSGSLAALQREVEVLADISHDNVVKIVDYGKFADGHLYLAMEFLQGSTGRHYCERATRLSPEQSIDFLRRMTGVLASMHPDQDKIDQLRTKRELSIEELHTLDLARHGYIHRDIKPENIIFTADRGPVLVDFGISAKVGTPVRTVSSTPGYLPPDGLNVFWLDFEQRRLARLTPSGWMHLEN